MKSLKFPMQPTSEFEAERWVVAQRLVCIKYPWRGYKCSDEKIREILRKHGVFMKGGPQHGEYHLKAGAREYLKLPDYIPDVGRRCGLHIPTDLRDAYSIVTGDIDPRWGYGLALNCVHFHEWDDQPHLKRLYY